MDVMEYRSDLFVSREKEIHEVRSLLESMHHAPRKEGTVIFYWGVGGVGKSYLLKHLEFLAKENQKSEQSKLTGRNTIVCRHKIGEAEDDKTVVLAASLAIVRAVLEQSGAIPHIANSSEITQLNELMRNHEAGQRTTPLAYLRPVERLLRRDIVLLLLIDTAESNFRTYKKRLEADVLELLVLTNRVGVVFAGRRAPGPGANWHSFEIRRRAVDPERTNLRGFTKNEMQTLFSQFQYFGYLPPAFGMHYALPTADRLPIDINSIFPYTGSSPMFVPLFQIAFEDLKRSILKVTERFYLEVLKKYREYLFLSLHHEPENRRYIEALIPLRYYRSETLEHVGPHWLGANRVYNARQMLETLARDTEYVRWDVSHRAYMTSRILRQVLDRVEMLENPKTYQEKHHSAIAFYTQEIKKYSSTCEESLIEKCFHYVSLYLEHLDQAQLSGQLGSVIDDAKRLLSDDRQDIMYRLLLQDLELKDLMPDQTWETLLSSLNPSYERSDLHSSTPLPPPTDDWKGPEQVKEKIIDFINSDATCGLYLISEPDRGRRQLELLQTIREQGEVVKSVRISDEISFLRPLSINAFHSRIADSLDPKHYYFEDFRKELKDYDTKRKDKEGYSQSELQQAQEVIERTFLRNYRSLANDLRIVLTFSATDKIETESEATQLYCEAQDYEEVLKEALLGLIRFEIGEQGTDNDNEVSGAPNTVFIFVGKRNQTLQKSFEATFEEISLKYDEDRLAPSNPDEIEAYLQVIETNDSQQYEGITEYSKQLSEMYQRLSEIVDDAFSYLLLLIEIFQKRSPYVVEQLYSQRNSTNIAQEIFKAFVAGFEPTQTFQYLRLARKGLTRDLLQHALGRSKDEIETIFKEFSRLRIVSSDTPGKDASAVLTLQDEVAELLERETQQIYGKYPWDNGDVKDLLKKVIGYYEKRIKDKEIRDKISLKDLRVNLLYYWLRYEPREGVAYYQQQAAEAIAGFNSDLDLHLRSEMLRFLRVYKAYDLPQREVEKHFNIDLAALDRSCAVRWLERFIVGGDYQKAIDIAEKLYNESEKEGFVWNKIEDANYKAGVLRAQGHALTFLEAESDDVEKLLHRSEEILLESPIGQIEPRFFRQQIKSNEEPETWWYYWNLGSTYHILGYYYSLIGSYQKAVAYLNNASEYLLTIGAEVQAANSLNTLAYSQGMLHDLSSAQSNALQALGIREELNIHDAIILSRITLANLYAWENYLKSAEVEIIKAETEARNRTNLRPLALTLIAKGYVYRKMADNWKTQRNLYVQEAEGNFKKSERALLQAIEIFEAVANKPKRATLTEPIRLWEAYNELGSLYCDWGAWYRDKDTPSPKLAIQHYNKALEKEFKAMNIAIERGLTVQTLDSYEDVAQIYGDLWYTYYQQKIESNPEIREWQQYKLKAEEYLEKVESQIKSERQKYHLKDGEGFTREHAPTGDILYRYLGNVERWRATWNFREAEFEKIKKDMTKCQEYATSAIEHIAHAYLYIFQFSAQDDYNLKRTVGHLNRFVDKLGISIYAVVDIVSNVEERYACDKWAGICPLHRLKEAFSPSLPGEGSPSGSSPSI